MQFLIKNYNALSRSLKDTLFLGIIFLSLVWVFRRYLFFSELFIFTDIGSDTMTMFFPSMLAGVRKMHTEAIGLWSFSTGIGQGTFGKGIINPFNWINKLLGPEHIAYGIGWLQFLRIFFISFISYHYLKLVKLGQESTYLGVILCTFMGYIMIGACWYGHLNNLVYMFLFILSFELILMKDKWWLLPIPVVFLFGPRLYFFTEFAIIYIIVRLALLNVLNWRTVFKAIPKFLLPGLLGIVLAAPFLGATVYKFLYSPRVGGEVSYTSKLMSNSIFDLESSLHYWTAIFRFFSNDILGTADDFKGWNNYLEAPIFYCGIISLLLFPQLFRYLNRKQLIVCLSVLLLWVSVIVFPYFRHAFYLFVGNYYKAALSFFIPFTILFFGVLAFHKIIQSKQVNPILLYLSFLTLILLLLFPPGQFDDQVIPQIRGFAAAFLILYTLLLSWFHFSKGKSIPLYILLFSVLIEGAYMANITINNRETISAKVYENRAFHNDYTLEALEYIHSIDEPFYRIEKAYGSVLSGYNDSNSQGFFDTRSYSSHNHNNYIQFLASIGLIKANDEVYTRWVVGVQNIPQLHPFFSVKYMISNPSKNKVDVAEWMYDDLGEMNGLRLYKNKYYLPLGIAFNQVMSDSEFERVVSYSQKLELLYKGVVVDDDKVNDLAGLRRISSNQLTGSINMNAVHNRLKDRGMIMESFKQSRIKGSISLAEPNILMFSFPFDEGWSVKVNDRREELIKINNGLTGLYLSAGNHQIDLKYRPPFYTAGWIVFFIGVFIYGFILFRQRHKNRSPIGSLATNSIIDLPPKIITKSKVVQKRPAKKRPTKKRKTRKNK